MPMPTFPEKWLSPLALIDVTVRGADAEIAPADDMVRLDLPALGYTGPAMLRLRAAKFDDDEIFTFELIEDVAVSVVLNVVAPAMWRVLDPDIAPATVNVCVGDDWVPIPVFQLP